MLVKWFELDSSKLISYDDDTLAHWAPEWIHRFRCIMGWKTVVWMSFMGTKYLKMHIMLVYRLIFWVTRVIKPIELRTVYPIVYILCVTPFISLSSFLCLFFLLLRFCRCIFCKPSRDLTRPLEGTKWFKGLIAYAKCNRDSYESELAL